MLRRNFFSEKRSAAGVTFHVAQRKHQLLIMPILFGAACFALIQYGQDGSLDRPLELAALMVGWITFLFWVPMAVISTCFWLFRKGRSAFTVEHNRIRLLVPQSGRYAQDIPRSEYMSVQWSGCTPVVIHQPAQLYVGGGLGAGALNIASTFQNGQAQMAGVVAAGAAMSSSQVTLSAGGQDYILAQHLTLPEAAALGRRVIAALSD